MNHFQQNPYKNFTDLVLHSFLILGAHPLVLALPIGSHRVVANGVPHKRLVREIADLGSKKRYFLYFLKFLNKFFFTFLDY